MRKTTLLLFASLWLLFNTVNAQSIPNTFTAVADAYVNDGTEANKNFGGLNVFYIKNDKNANVTRESFLKFDLSSLSGTISTATLRLYPTLASLTGLQNRAELVDDDSWQESTITWNTKPASSTQIGSDWTVVDGEYVELDVTQAVLDAVSEEGDNLLSVRIYSPTKVKDAGLVGYASRENSEADYRPVILINYAPVFTSTPVVEVVQETPYNYAVTASDMEGDNITLSAPTLPDWLTFTDNGNGNGVLSGTPTSSDVGDHSVVLRASDDNQRATEQAFTITVIANAPPTASDDSEETDEDVSVDINVLANDTDSDGSIDPTTVQVTTEAGSGQTSVDAQTGVITYTPDENFFGTDEFAYTVKDDQGAASQPATVIVTVNPVNDDPVAVDDETSTQEEVAINIDVLSNDIDVDGDVLEVIEIKNVVGGTATIEENGIVHFEPDTDFYGEASFIYVISDGAGGNDEAEVIINVNNKQDKPRAVADEAVTLENEAVTIDVLSNDSDPDGDELTLIDAGSPEHGETEIVDNKIVYTPEPGFVGNDEFEYTVSDGKNTDRATVSITVTSDNAAPVANADLVTIEEDSTVDIDVLANDSDSDGDSLSISILNQPAHGTAVVSQTDTSGAVITYTPEMNYAGQDTLTYQVDDGNGGTASADVIITITPVNDAPSAVVITNPVPGSSVVIGGSASEPAAPDTPFTIEWDAASDPDDDELEYTWQIALADSFTQNTVLFNLEVGNSTSLVSDYGTIAGLLDVAGVVLDSSIVLYHRIVASDSEVMTPGIIASIRLTRGAITGIDHSADIPAAFTLEGNYPNPFNPSTTVRFDLPEAAKVRIELYDITGRQVRSLPDKDFSAGSGHSILVDASDLVSGIYIYRVIAVSAKNTYMDTGRMVLVK